MTPARRETKSASAAPARPASRATASPLARDAVAAACALLVYLATSGALFTFAPLVQCALVTGALVGLIASRWERAALAAAIALAVGWLVAPPVVADAALGRADLMAMLAVALGAAAAAALTRLAVSAGGRAVAQGAVIVLVGLLVANLWATSLTTVASTPIGRMPLATWLEVSNPQPGTVWYDDEAWLQVYKRMRQGTNLYEAERTVLLDNALWGKPPATIFDGRPPMFFWLMGLVAPTPSGILYGLLVLSSLAVIASAILAAQLVRLPLAVVGAAITTAHLLFFTVTTNVVFADAWAAPFVIAGVAALVFAARRVDWVVAFSAGAACAALAASMREFALALPLAGAVSSLQALVAGPRKRGRAQLFAWAGAFGVLGVYYAAHFLTMNPITGGKAGIGFHWLRPDLNNLAMVLVYGSGPFSVNSIVPYLFAALGLLGIALSPSGQVRTLLITFVVMPMMVFVFFRPEAAGPQGQGDYWGTIILPVIYACVPVAFAVVPGMRRPAPTLEQDVA